MYTLDKLEVGESAFIDSLNITGNFRRRLLDLGIIKGSEITALYKSPAKNPTAYFIKGTVIAIRDEDAKNILLIKN